MWLGNNPPQNRNSYIQAQTILGYLRKIFPPGGLKYSAFHFEEIHVYSIHILKVE